MTICKVYAGICALTISAVMAACGSSPSSPSPANDFSEGGARFSNIADPGLPQTAETLKATAPGPTSPADGALVSLAPTLEVTSPRAVYGVPWVFEVRFEVYALANPATAVYSSLVLQGEGRTSHTLPSNVLQDQVVYVWRARAESEGQGGPWSGVSSFTTQFVAIDPPTPLQPIGGVVTQSLRPQLFVTNPPTSGSPKDIGRLLVEFEVATDDQFLNVVEFGRTTARDRGETGYTLLKNLAPDTPFYWRARGTNKNLPITAILDSPAPDVDVEAVFVTTSGWSTTATFRSPTAEAAQPPGGGGGFGGTGSSPNAPFTTSGGNATNLLGVILGVAAAHPEALANSCQDHGGTWEFMDRAVEALRAIDGRWGYNCKRGDCSDLSLDVVDYYMGSGTSTAQANGSSAVDIFDIIVAHCGPNPTVGFNSLTDATKANGDIGRWKYPR